MSDAETRWTWGVRAAATVLCLVLGSTDLRAGDTIPASVQVMLFSKIWLFDRSLAGNERLVVAVLYQESFQSSAREKDQLIQAARRSASRDQYVPLSLDHPDDVVNALESVKADLFYITEMRGVDIGAITRLSRRRHIKTITVVAAYLQSGVAIGLGVRGDKPDILINLGAARAEGSDLSAQLLRRATIIDGPAEQ